MFNEQAKHFFLALVLSILEPLDFLIVVVQIIFKKGKGKKKRMVGACVSFEIRSRVTCIQTTCGTFDLEML